MSDHARVRDYERLRQTENTFSYNGIVFMCAGKCACSSIRYAMLQHMGALDSFRSVHSHPALPEVKHTELRFGGQYDDWPVVAVVRHPWDRIVSFWRDKIAQRPATDDRYAHLGLWGGASLQDTIKQVCRNIDVRDTHTRPLYHIYSDPVTGELYPTHILRFERLAQDWSNLQRIYKWLPDLPHKNRASVPPVLPVGMDRARQLVTETYAVDFHRFGYMPVWAAGAHDQAA